MSTEFELIEKISQTFKRPEGVSVGIGDDCAVLDPGRFDLVTVDTLVEGIHFRSDWASPEEIGWKALATNLSDVAAMGGGPGAFFLSLSLPAPLDVPWVEGLLAGMKAAAMELVPDSFEVSLAGGDLTESKGPRIISITLLGEASPAGPVLRKGAVPGDQIVLIGSTGLSEGGLKVVEEGLDKKAYAALVECYHRPRPNLKAGALLGLYGIPSAMLDVSDGLLADLGHLMKASKVGARITGHKVPRHPELEALEKAGYGNALQRAISGGEDFALLLTVPPSRMPKLWDLANQNDWKAIDIGEVRSPDEGLTVSGLDGEPLKIEKTGFRHFEES